MMSTEDDDMAFVIKTDIPDPDAQTFSFTAQKTMYGGKHIAEGDTVFLFASENEGGRGLVAKGTVSSEEAVARTPDIDRQTPRVSIIVKCTTMATKPLGRTQLKPFRDWDDGQPETELNFKLYRQATNKIVGISEVTARFLERHFA
jgi:hypothetical protein